MGVLTNIDNFFYSLFHHDEDVVLAEFGALRDDLFQISEKLAILEESIKSVHSDLLLLKAYVPKPEKNTIDKEEVKEIDLAMGDRIPLVDGMKVVLEGTNDARVMHLS